MSSDEGGTEQKQLTEEKPEPDPSRTVQERILALYQSNKMIDTAAGFWGKLVVETIIVTAPLIVVILIPGWIAAYFDLHPWFTYLGVALTWMSFTISIMAIVWCFTEATVESQD